MIVKSLIDMKTHVSKCKFDKKFNKIKRERKISDSVQLKVNLYFKLFCFLLCDIFFRKMTCNSIFNLISSCWQHFYLLWIHWESAYQGEALFELARGVIFLQNFSFYSLTWRLGVCFELRWCVDSVSVINIFSDNLELVLFSGACERKKAPLHFC